MVGNISDALFNFLKISAVVAVAAVFLTAILGFINLIHVFVFGNIVNQIFALISLYLPFDANAIIAGLFTSAAAIFSFMIAKKIFDLTSWSISAV